MCRAGITSGCAIFSTLISLSQEGDEEPFDEVHGWGILRRYSSNEK